MTKNNISDEQKKLEDLRDQVREILRAHPEVGWYIQLSIQLEDGVDILHSGDCCAPCALDAMNRWIQHKNIQHNVNQKVH